MNIYLLRHGETTSDVENRYGGIYDDELTDTGREQIRQLAEKLRDTEIEHIFSSSLTRAKQSTEIIRELLTCSAEYEENLRERNFYSMLSGMKKEEAQEKYPELVALLSDRHNTLPDGESYEDFSRRIAGVWERVLRSEFNNVAIMTHGGPIRTIVLDILNKGEISELNNCAFFELTEQDGTVKIVRVENAKLEN